jgi:hypothetical protein
MYAVAAKLQILVVIPFIDTGGVLYWGDGLVTDVS